MTGRSVIYLSTYVTSSYVMVVCTATVLLYFKQVDDRIHMHWIYLFVATTFSNATFIIAYRSCKDGFSPHPGWYHNGLPSNILSGECRRNHDKTIGCPSIMTPRRNKEQGTIFIGIYVQRQEQIFIYNFASELNVYLILNITDDNLHVTILFSLLQSPQFALIAVCLLKTMKLVHC